MFTIFVFLINLGGKLHLKTKIFFFLFLPKTIYFLLFPIIQIIVFFLVSTKQNNIFSVKMISLRYLKANFKLCCFFVCKRLSTKSRILETISNARSIFLPIYGFNYATDLIFQRVGGCQSKNRTILQGRGEGNGKQPEYIPKEGYYILKKTNR